MVETQPNFVKLNLQAIENELAPFGTTLLPVTKTFGPDLILKAYEAGHRAFGENKVQELVPKYEALPKDISWHLIGHLQTNKVKYIAPFIGMIESVDSAKLLAEIDKQAARCQRIIPCLLQVYIATEETKFGWDVAELQEWLATNALEHYAHIRIEGLMGMASFSSDAGKVRAEFRSLKALFDQLKKTETDRFQMNTLSMGMSGDYRIACEEGSTLVRMGTAVFGKR